MKRTGSCLCSEVTFEAEPMLSMQACHCSMCRIWTAGPFMSVPCQNASFAGLIGEYAPNRRRQLIRPNDQHRANIFRLSASLRLSLSPLA